MSTISQVTPFANPIVSSDSIVSVNSETIQKSLLSLLSVFTSDDYRVVDQITTRISKVTPEISKVTPNQIFKMPEISMLSSPSYSGYSSNSGKHEGTPELSETGDVHNDAKAACLPEVDEKQLLQERFENASGLSKEEFSALVEQGAVGSWSASLPNEGRSVPSKPYTPLSKRASRLKRKPGRVS